MCNRFEMLSAYAGETPASRQFIRIMDVGFRREVRAAWNAWASLWMQQIKIKDE